MAELASCGVMVEDDACGGCVVRTGRNNERLKMRMEKNRGATLTGINQIESPPTNEELCPPATQETRILQQI